MNLENNFNELYNNFLIEYKSSFDEIADQRLKALYENKKNKIIVRNVEILLLIVLIFSFINNKTAGEITVAIFMIYIMLSLTFPIIIVMFKNNSYREYDTIYKEKITRNFIRYICPTLEYYPNDYIEYNDYKNIAIENCINFYSKNVIKGTYKNNRFIASKIHSQYTHYDGPIELKRTRSFNGLYVKFELSKNSNVDLFVKAKSQLNDKLYDTFALDFNHLMQSEKNNTISGYKFSLIENDQLNNIFSIYSSNPNCEIIDQEISSILRELYNIQEFEFVIKKNYLYIRLWNGYLFSEPALKNEEFAKKILYDIYKTIYLSFYIFDIIEKKI